MMSFSELIEDLEEFAEEDNDTIEALVERIANHYGFEVRAITSDSGESR